MATTLAHASAFGPRQRVTPSPDNTCGPQANGTYVCPLVTPCCSSSGYCGAGDQYCLTSLGCQAGFSNTFAGGNCYAPTDKETRSPDGTCGKTGVGEHGYRCPVEGGSRLCCSA
ncbi:hypothetical protein C8A01DRAFT_18569 [Parachaetomium inaequale]|uniref:Chitin-binding type-1 domain-containing protein n=1 Tax=Parachaetomium inaequale TaxID=2588326 RepID=A0AAN6PE25_9PEZI|nr:hypothetical protein C8A01DRAFT_18569 [Parachaetomium inaequale]